MFENIKIYFAMKKAQEPLSAMMKGTIDLLTALGMSVYDIENYHLAYVLAWYNVLYSHLFDDSETLQIGLVALLQNHLLKHGNSTYDVEEVLECRMKFTSEIISKVKHFKSTSAFFAIMADTAKNFFVEDGAIKLNDESCVSTIARYERAFISKFDKDGSYSF